MRRASRCSACRRPSLSRCASPARDMPRRSSSRGRRAPAEPRAEVVVAVATGAAVRGRITPASALAMLRARVPDKLGPNQAEIAQLYATGVRLWREGTAETRPPGVLGREPVVLADDGSFELGGLAPGAWRMFFQYGLNLESETPGRLPMPHQFETELPKF